MDKGNLLARLEEKATACAETDEHKRNDLLAEIKVLLDSFPKDYDFATLDSVRYYLISKIPGETNPLEILKSVCHDLGGTLNTDAGSRMNIRKKHGMFTFLFFILLFAAAAIACAIAVAFVEETNPCYDLLDKSATIFGLLDFALGAGGFVWERISDMRNKETATSLHESAEKMQKAETPEELAGAVAKFHEEFSKFSTVIQVSQHGFLNFHSTNVYNSRQHDASEAVRAKANEILDGLASNTESRKTQNK